MKFENFDNQNEDEKQEEKTELSPEMQELYDEIVGDSEQNALKEKAEKMDYAERFKVLKEAVKRVGKLTRKIALVAFVGFSPSLAGSADSVKVVKENLKNETGNEWQKVETEKTSPKYNMEEGGYSPEMFNDKEVPDQKKNFDFEKLSPKEKEDREIWAIINSDPRELTTVRHIPGGIPANIRDAYRAGLFKNHEEYEEWNKNTRIERSKRYVKKYPDAFEEIKSNIDKFKNLDDEKKRTEFNYLIKKYNIDEGSNELETDRETNPYIVIYGLLDRALNDLGVDK